MRWLWLLIIVGLTLGPFGHLSQSHPFTPNLLIVFLWAISWFNARSQTLALAIVGGLLIDLVGWNWFGIWTVSAVAVVLIINALKGRLLEAGSILHALLALAIVSLVAPFLLSVATQGFAIKEIGLVILGNVTLGAVVYYLLAMRLSLFQRWAGRRIG
ncbi:MAG: hypothetical protein NUV80_02530 [Candidatus Berkelbacteria bacterium]|nr:hypothetical protein [Candidatus Berkelbacteria bacterium]MCR4307409.1 hypothetical protein [Candidatus Berkelbacteria bacterium]